MPTTAKPTSDLAQGKRNLDEFGYTVHEDLLSSEEVARLRDRLLEQADMECAQGVATYRLGANRHRVIANAQIGADIPYGQPAVFDLSHY